MKAQESTMHPTLGRTPLSLVFGSSHVAQEQHADASWRRFSSNKVGCDASVCCTWATDLLPETGDGNPYAASLGKWADLDAANDAQGLKLKLSGNHCCSLCAGHAVLWT